MVHSSRHRLWPSLGWHCTTPKRNMSSPHSALAVTCGLCSDEESWHACGAPEALERGFCLQVQRWNREGGLGASMVGRKSSENTPMYQVMDGQRLISTQPRPKLWRRLIIFGRFFPSRVLPAFHSLHPRLASTGDRGSTGLRRGITMSVCISEVRRKLFDTRRTGDGDGTARHGRGTGVPTFPAGQSGRRPGLLPDGWGDGPHDDGMAALQVELSKPTSADGMDGEAPSRKTRLIDWADRMRFGWSSGGAGKDVHGWDTLAFSFLFSSLFSLVIHAN